MTHCFSPNAASHGNPSWPGGLVQACCGTTKAGRILRRFPSNPFFAAAELFASVIKEATKPLHTTLRSPTQLHIKTGRRTLRARIRQYDTLEMVHTTIKQKAPLNHKNTS